MIEAKIDVQSHSDDPTYVAAYEISLGAYLESLRLVLLISTQYKALYAVVEDNLNLQVADLTALQVKFAENIAALTTGLLKNVVAIKVDFTLHFPIINAHLSAMLQALIGISDVSISVDIDTHDQGIIILIDLVGVGEDDQMGQYHEECIFSTLALLLGTTDCVVSKIVGQKRSTSPQYRAIIGSTSNPPEPINNSVDPDIPVTSEQVPVEQPNPQPEIPKETISDSTDYVAEQTSSASSFAFSIVTLIGIVLCFF